MFTNVLLQFQCYTILSFSNRKKQKKTVNVQTDGRKVALDWIWEKNKKKINYYLIDYNWINLMWQDSLCHKAKKNENVLLTHIQIYIGKYNYNYWGIISQRIYEMIIERKYNVLLRQNFKKIDFFNFVLSLSLFFSPFLFVSVKDGLPCPLI